MSQTYRIGPLNFTGSQAVLSASLDVSGSGRFTNGLTVTGSFTVITGSSIELEVLNTGVRMGSAITDVHTATGSLIVSGTLETMNRIVVPFDPAFGIRDFLFNKNGSPLLSTVSTDGMLTKYPFICSSSLFLLGGILSHKNQVGQGTGLVIQGSGTPFNNQPNSPAHRIVITGSIGLQSNSYLSMFSILPSVTLDATSGSSAGIIGYYFSASSDYKNAYNRAFQSVNGDVMFGTSGTGNVYIGTSTTSSFKLDVSGSGRFTDGLIVTGSFTVHTGSTEFQILNTGTKIGNASIDAHTMTGSFGVQGSVAITNFLTASAALISGSGDSRLRVIGSGSSNPILTVGGSSGQLLTVTDSLSGTLFSVNNISALPILSVNSDDTVKIGASNAMGLYTSYRVVTTAANTEIYKVLTASYDALYVDYSIRSGSNARAGQFISIWSGSQVNYTEISASQFGDTSGFTLAAYISESFMNISSSATTNGWDIKTIIRSI
jgi:hypothetical protein